MPSGFLWNYFKNIGFFSKEKIIYIYHLRWINDVPKHPLSIEYINSLPTHIRKQNLIDDVSPNKIF